MNAPTRASPISSSSSASKSDTLALSPLAGEGSAPCWHDEGLVRANRPQTDLGSGLVGRSPATSRPISLSTENDQLIRQNTKGMHHGRQFRNRHRQLYEQALQQAKAAAAATQSARFSERSCDGRTWRFRRTRTTALGTPRPRRCWGAQQQRRPERDERSATNKPNYTANLPLVARAAQRQLNGACSRTPTSPPHIKMTRRPAKGGIRDEASRAFDDCP